VPLTVERSTFDRNATQAADNGLFTPIVFGGAIGISGAIYPVNIARSRLTQNTSQRGAAIWATGVAVSIDRSLVTGNTATGIDAIPGDAALSSSGTFTFAHTMLRDNAPASCQLGAVVDGGHNSEAGGTSCFDAKPPK
jgi:hypothetical protein